MTEPSMLLPHDLTLKERCKLTMTGVTEVLGFDDTAVLLQTTLGELTVEGQQLQLRQLLPEGGRVEITGHICTLRYTEPREGGWLRRLLK